jgi:hypothetical protein
MPHHPNSRLRTYGRRATRRKPSVDVLSRRSTSVFPRQQSTNIDTSYHEQLQPKQQSKSTSQPLSPSKSTSATREEYELDSDDDTLVPLHVPAGKLSPVDRLKREKLDYKQDILDLKRKIADLESASMKRCETVCSLTSLFSSASDSQTPRIKGSRFFWTLSAKRLNAQFVAIECKSQGRECM